MGRSCEGWRESLTYINPSCHAEHEPGVRRDPDLDGLMRTTRQFLLPGRIRLCPLRLRRCQQTVSSSRASSRLSHKFQRVIVQWFDHVFDEFHAFNPRLGRLHFRQHLFEHREQDRSEADGLTSQRITLTH